MNNEDIEPMIWKWLFAIVMLILVLCQSCSNNNMKYLIAQDTIADGWQPAEFDDGSPIMYNNQEKAEEALFDMLYEEVAYHYHKMRELDKQNASIQNKVEYLESLEFIDVSGYFVCSEEEFNPGRKAIYVARQ